jgi:hypothetical protein
LGYAPPDLWLYETAVDFGFKDPEELRQWAREDLYWVRMVAQARPLVTQELARRKAESESSADKGQADE